MANQLNNWPVYLTIVNPVVMGNPNDNNHQLLREHAVPAIYNVLNLYAMSQTAILTAVFSMERSTGHEIWWSPVMLSGFISAAMIAAVLHGFFEEYSVMRGGSHLRNFLINHWMWVLQKATILMMLLAIALCLLFSFTRLLFSRPS